MTENTEKKLVKGFEELSERLEEQASKIPSERLKITDLTIKQSNQKIYVVDTNAIIDNPACLEKLGEGGNLVVLPTPVIQELEKHAKSSNPQKHVPARQANRILRDLRRANKIYHNLETALKKDSQSSFDNGGKFSWTGANYTPINSDVEADDQILDQTLELKKQHGNLAEVVLVTEDIALQLKADSQGLNVEELRMGKAKVRSADQVYSGVTEFFVSKELLDKFLASGEGVNRFVELTELKRDLKNLSKTDELKLIFNQGVILTDFEKTNNSMPTIYNPKENRLECLKYAIGVNERDIERIREENEKKGRKNDLFYQYFYLKDFFNTKPRDVYQLYYMEHLINPAIHFLVVNGRSGTGKTREAMAAALHLILNEERLIETFQAKGHQFGKNDVLLRHDYKKGLLILKPEVASMDYGFLPGDLEEKISPYLVPFFEEINDMTEKYNRHGFNFLQHLKDNKILQSEATAFLRGRSLGDRITVIDELQNGNRAMAKLYISRLDHGSKNIAMGDINQIDNEHVGINNNALTLLTEVIQKRPKPEVAVIKLERSQRLKLASEYEDLLSQ
ncbi:hypothetical protein COV11_00180 [Candidatus Woesearchaeota archaeon CG10_big_fil_rev_8_21_14_0_10_30_7]|nr:MAG: hypothetical protein COV11_00180 [Candidatus Woesearchaeota archaeon CG10_big_fil_rev_8_21_14_0_10_30_7]